MSELADIQRFIDEQARDGFELWVEGENLRFKAPQSLLTPDRLAALKSRKALIVQWLMLQQTQQPSLAAADAIESRFELSASQAAIWMLQKFAPRSPVYNTTLFLQLKQHLPENGVRRVLQALLSRHPLLRTTFHDTDTGAEQRVHRYLPANLEFIEVMKGSEAQLQTWLDYEADTPFQLGEESLLRIKILQNTLWGPMMVVTVHHLIADLWSLLLIANDLQQLMQQFLQEQALMLPALNVNYSQHVQAQQKWLNSDAGEQAWRYWHETLMGAPGAVEIPTDTPRPAMLQFDQTKSSFFLSGEESARVRAFCKTRSITPFVLMQSVYQLFLHIESGERDFLLGTPTVGRYERGMEAVVGDFANPVVLRAKINPDDTLVNFLVSVRETVLCAMQHDRFPFPELVQRLNPPRDPSRAPLFQWMFLWHQAQLDMAAASDWLESMLPQSGPRGTPYDLMFSVTDRPEGFEGHWHAAKALYSETRLLRFTSVFKSLLEIVLEAPTQTVADALENIAIKFDTASAKNACELNWGYWQGQHENLHEMLLKRIPEIDREFVMLARHTHKFETFNCVFIVAADQQQVYAIANCEFVHHVVNVPGLPRLLSGEIDLDALLKIPTVNWEQLQQLSPHLAVVHIPRLTIEYQHVSKCLESSATSIVRSEEKQTENIIDLELSQRPLAYAAGAPLNNYELADNLLHALQTTAQGFPARGIHYLDDVGNTQDFLSYAELLKVSHDWLPVFEQYSIAENTITILQIRDRKRYHGIFWGLLRAGALPLTIANPEQWHERDAVALKLRNVAQRFKSCVILTDQLVAPIIRWVGESIRVVGITTAESSSLAFSEKALSEKPLSENSENVLLNKKSEDNPVAFLQLTSGSTGTPKAIQITHRGILHHIEASRIHNNYSNEDISLNWLPYDHVVPLLTTHIKDVVLGCEQYQLPTNAVLSYPLLWLRVMSQRRVTHSWTPNFGFQLVAEQLQKTDEALSIDLASVKKLMNAGEQVMAATVRHFVSRCAPYGLRSDAVQPAFGMAECCTCMTYANDADIALDLRVNPANGQVLKIDEHGQHSFVNLGEVTPGTEIRIADAAGITLPEGVIGRLQIRGPVITPGYLENPAANAEAFVGDGWFNSGDLGFMWQRRLYITGREKEMIVVRGNNYYCHEIELLATVAGVMPSFVAATGVHGGFTGEEQLIIFYVPDTINVVDKMLHQRELEENIARTMLETYGIRPAYIIAVKKSEFHKTTSGKIQRGKFKSLFEAGQYRDAVLAYDLRHAFNLLKPAVYKACLVAEEGVYSPITQVEIPFFLAPSSLSTTISQYSALADKAWYWLDTDSSFVHLSFEISTTHSEWVVVLPAHFEYLSWLASLAKHISTLSSPPHQVLLISISESNDSYLVKSTVESLRGEIPLTRFKHVGIAEPAIEWKMLQWEMYYRTHDVTVSLNKAGRHVPRLQRYQFSPAQEERLTLVAGDVVIVTGGTGALGRILCQWLIDQLGCRLLLVTRKNAADTTFTALSADPRKIQICTFDPTNIQTLETTILDGLAHWNTLQPAACFHLAGSMPLIPLAECDACHNEKAWQGKVELAEQLYALLSKRFSETASKIAFIQYSSLNAFFGGHSAGLYGAANAAQSELTERINREGKLRAWTLHWSQWKNLGMSSRLDAQQQRMAHNQGYLALATSDAMRVLKAVLTQSPDNYYIGCDETNPAISPFVYNANEKWQWRSMCLAAPEARPIDFTRLLTATTSCLPGYRYRVGTTGLELRKIPSSFIRNAQGEIDVACLSHLITDNDAVRVCAPRNETETRLLALWNECLPVPVLGVDENFFDKGGHSIIAARLIARINQAFSLNWPVAALFQHPTVVALATYLNTNDTQSQPKVLISPAIATLAEHRELIMLGGSTNKTTTQLWLPPLLGSPQPYRTLLAGARVIPCLWQEGLNHETLPSIANQASRYAAYWGENAPTSEPLILVGWSFAGVLAFELAHQLANRGLSIAAVIMLDSAIGDAIPWAALDTTSRRMLFLREVDIDISASAVMSLLSEKELSEKELSEKDLSDEMWCEALQSICAENLQKNDMHRLFQRFSSKLQALSEYQPADWQSQRYPVYYIKASRNPLGTSTMGWHNHFSQFTTQFIDTDHHALLHDRSLLQWLNLNFSDASSRQGARYG